MITGYWFLRIYPVLFVFEEKVYVKVSVVGCTDFLFLNIYIYIYLVAFGLTIVMAHRIFHYGGQTL